MSERLQSLLSAILGAYVLSAAFLGGAVVLTLLVTHRAPSWRRLPALLSWGAFAVIVLALASARL